MFEHYMTYQAVDPRRQKAIMAASVVSGIVTFSMIVFAWAANKMDISKVEPPTINYIVFQLAMEEPPPPPPPPPPPAGDTEEVEEEKEDVPDEEVPEEEIVQPKETPDKVPEAKKVGKSGSRVPGGVPGGIPGGVPGGVVGGVLGGQLGGQLGGVATKRDPQQAAAMQPVASVMQQAIYAPDPTSKDFESTKAARFDKRPGTNKTSFCIDPSGKVVDVRTKQKFPGDPKVDEIIRDKIAKWRFKPFVVGGKPVKTCTVATFDLKFK